MEHAEFTISDQHRKPLCIPLSDVAEGKWLSVGASKLCDIFCDFIAPDENVQVSRFADFIGLRVGQSVTFGFKLVLCKVRARNLCVRIVRDEPACAREYVLGFQAFFGHVFQDPGYDSLKEKVLSHFDSRWLAPPVELARLADLATRVSAIFDGDVQGCAEKSLALFADVFLEGPLSSLLSDPQISEVVSNGDDLLWVERHGTWSACSLPFCSWDAFERWLLYQSSQAHAELYTVNHFSDFVLRCGARVHVSFPPIARSRAYVTIRSHKAALGGLAEQDFVLKEKEDLRRLLHAFDMRKNILIVGPTGSGKTTLLRFLLEQSKGSERILVLEDTPELRISRPHVVYLQTSERGVEQAPSVDLSALVRESLRMRPDRIVVGECRGAEAFALLQALHTGHRGTLCTLHASSVEDAIDRFQTLVLQGHPSLGNEVVRRMIFSCIDVVVSLCRDSDGSRGLSEVRELTGGLRSC